MKYFALSVLLCIAVVEISGYRTHSALNSLIFMNKDITEQKDDVHSEYYFGKCATEDKKLIYHDSFIYEQIEGNIIIRGHLKIADDIIPNCVYIKATSPFGDMVRYHAYKFTVCFLTIIVNYMGELHYHYYYEWFVPVEMREGIDWELYFYVA